MTSSGLTHHINQIYQICNDGAKATTNKFYVQSEAIIDFNFGMIEVERNKNNELIVKIEIRDYDNAVREK